jgi:flagellar biosynthesis protein FlhA
MKIKKFNETQSRPIMLCSPSVRIHLKRIVEKFITNLAILLHSDIDIRTKIKSMEVVNINDAA